MWIGIEWGNPVWENGRDGLLILHIDTRHFKSFESEDILRDYENFKNSSVNQKSKYTVKILNFCCIVTQSLLQKTQTWRHYGLITFVKTEISYKSDGVIICKKIMQVFNYV